MINFIIYESDINYRKKYISIILKIIGKTGYKYNIIEISKYNEEKINNIQKLNGYNIFILEIDVLGKSGIDLIKEIRNNNDWQSIMIIVTKHDNLLIPVYSSKLLIYSILSKYINYEEELYKTLISAIKIISKHKFLKFKYLGEYYRIHYKDILYIYKDNKNPLLTIVTKNENIDINKNLCSIYEMLEDYYMFIKVNRSLIVNTDNIIKISLKNNTIYFKYNAIKLDSNIKLKRLIEITNENYNDIAIDKQKVN